MSLENDFSQTQKKKKSAKNWQILLVAYLSKTLNH